MQSAPYILDTCILGITTIVTVASSVVLNEVTTDTAERLELQLLLLPLIGSLCVSGGLIMLNPQPETRRIVIGRGIIALFCGVIGPQLVGLAHPSLAAVGVKPIAALASGGLIAGLAYVMSKPLFGQFYHRAESIAKREADRIEARFSPKVEDPTKKL